VIIGFMGKGFEEEFSFDERIIKMFFYFFDGILIVLPVQFSNFLKSRHALVPPNPKELESA